MFSLTTPARAPLDGGGAVEYTTRQGLADIARHVIQRTMYHRFLS